MTKKENATSAGNFGEYRGGGEKNEAISLLSGNKSSTRTSRKQVVGSPEWVETWKDAQYAITWTEENPDAWLHAFIEPMEQCKEQGRKFSIHAGSAPAPPTTNLTKAANRTQRSHGKRREPQARIISGHPASRFKRRR